MAPIPKRQRDLGRDLGEATAERVRAAFGAGTPLRIVGGGSKSFYGGACAGETLAMQAHAGILDYEPSELYLEARAGTPLPLIEETLAAKGQMLPFEPPHFAGGATLGGCIASGLSGPGRISGGAVRDAMLGVLLVNGRGERLRFGGRVMKNVAGYDISRLMTGALGTLGILLEATVRLLPVPAAQLSLALEMPPETALAQLRLWVRRGLPLSASFHDGERLFLRLSSGPGGVAAARRAIGGERCDDESLWRDIRDQRNAFFRDAAPLWRISLPPASAPLPLPGRHAFEWHGALRWAATDAPAATVRELAAGHGGHACLFRPPPSPKHAPEHDRKHDPGHDPGQAAPAAANADTGAAQHPFHPLPEALLALHRRLKRAFDPAGILNPGRLYPGM